jgi:hypothetical protein
MIGPMLGAVGIQYLIILAGSQSVIDPNLGLGIVLVVFVLLVPQGIVPVIRNWLPLRIRQAGQEGTAQPARDVAEAGQ